MIFIRLFFVLIHSFHTSFLSSFINIFHNLFCNLMKNKCCLSRVFCKLDFLVKMPLFSSQEIDILCKFLLLVVFLFYQFYFYANFEHFSSFSYLRITFKNNAFRVFWCTEMGNFRRRKVTIHCNAK